MRSTPWPILLLALSLPLVAGCPGGDDDDSAGDDDATGDDDDATDDDDAFDPPDPTGVRRLLLEGFTNTGCGPCADTNPIIDAFLASAGVGNVVPVKIHTDWPSPDDPFYVGHAADCDARVDYYGIDAVPATRVDGLQPLSWSGGNHYSDIGVLFDRPLEVDLSAGVITGDEEGDYRVAVAVEPTEALAAARELTLHVIATQLYLEYASAPGPNGETEFHDAAIAFLPDGNGTAITVAPGDARQVFPFELTLDEAWERDQLEIVAFVQDDGTQEVLQATTSEPVPAHAFRLIGALAECTFIEPDGSVTLSVDLQNSGPFMDTFDLETAVSGPEGWDLAWAVDGEPLDPEEPVAALEVGERAELSLTVTPNDVVGSGSGLLEVTPHCEAEPLQELAVHVGTYGVDALLVDADGGEAYEEYVAASLDAAGMSHATWRGETGFEDLELSRFPVIVWNAGWYFPHFTDAEKAALTAYLDAGGSLFISGQDIGWDLCDPSSAWADCDWYRDTLRAEYVSDDTDDTAMTGVAGDPIGDGLQFDIAGGDGADNQQYPSEIQPIDAEAACFVEYSDGACGAVHGHTAAGGAVVYLAFGFEAIADATSRDLLLARALGWLAI